MSTSPSDPPGTANRPLVADEAIPELLRVFGESSSFDAGLDAGIDVIARYTAFDAVAFLRLSASGQSLSLVSSRGFNARAVEAGETLPVDGSFTGLAVKRREIVTSRDAVRDPRIVPGVRDEMATLEHQLLISVPLLLYRRAVGAMNLVWSEVRDFRDEERDCLYCLSYGIAVAIEHTRRDHESRHDVLTGLLNRREFDRLLHDHAARWRRVGTPFSLLWIDVDRFKDLNDVHGHAFGDRVLKDLAELLRSRTREADFAFRCGGEEFACLLPDTGQDGARVLAEDLRRRFATLEHQTTGSGKVVATMSIGVAEYGGERPADFVDRTDALLYEAKVQGRNRVQSSGRGRR